MLVLNAEQEERLREIICYNTCDKEFKDMMEWFADYLPDHPLLEDEQAYWEIEDWDEIPEEHREDFKDHICGKSNLLIQQMNKQKREQG